MLEVFVTLIGIICVVFLLIKKIDASISLFSVGVALMIVSALLDHSGYTQASITPSDSILLDQFSYIAGIMVKRIQIVGITIMVLFGYSRYMDKIGANERTVYCLTIPLLWFRVRYFIIPVAFWLGNLMQLALPSASSLSLLFLTTLYPTIVAAGVSRAAAAAAVATTATIIPTPLGIDNIVAARYLGIPLGEYVFDYHARISIPVLIVVGVIHYFWQKYLDKKQVKSSSFYGVDGHRIKGDNSKANQAPVFYALFPLLPLIIVLGCFAIEQMTSLSLNLSLLPISIMCLTCVVIIEIIRKRSLITPLVDIKSFFDGMGEGFSRVVVLVIGAGILVSAIDQMGVIDRLILWDRGIGYGNFILMLAFTVITCLLTLITGSGLAAFHSLINVIPHLSEQMGINGALLSLPIQLSGNLMRSVSPVSAVVLIVASATKVPVLEVVKRTSMPMVIGVIMSTILVWFTIPHHI